MRITLQEGQGNIRPYFYTEETDEKQESFGWHIPGRLLRGNLRVENPPEGTTSIYLRVLSPTQVRVSCFGEKRSFWLSHETDSHHSARESVSLGEPVFLEVPEDCQAVVRDLWETLQRRWEQQADWDSRADWRKRTLEAVREIPQALGRQTEEIEIEITAKESLGDVLRIRGWKRVYRFQDREVKVDLLVDYALKPTQKEWDNSETIHFCRGTFITKKRGGLFKEVSVFFGGKPSSI